MKKPVWKILLIDDDEDDFLITRENLSQVNSRGVELTWASTYEKGLSLALGAGKGTTDGFDAILMDYDLGIQSGIQLTREILNQGCKTPIILLTGRGSYEVDVEAMQAGVSLYITKSEANPLLLERVIRYAIERKNAEELLMNRNARLSLLSYLASELLSNRDPIELLDDISPRMKEIVGLDVYVHYQVARSGKNLELASLAGYPDVVRDQLKNLSFGQAVCGTVAMTCRPIIAEDVQNRSDERTQLIRSLGITCYACHPLMSQGHLFGTLSFGSRSRTHLDSESIEMLRTVCDLIAIAFERREKERELVKNIPIPVPLRFPPKNRV